MKFSRTEITTPAQGGAFWLVTAGPLRFVLHCASNVVGGNSLSIENVVYDCCVQSEMYQYCDRHGPMRRVWFYTPAGPILGAWLEEAGVPDAAQAGLDLAAWIREQDWFSVSYPQWRGR